MAIIKPSKPALNVIVWIRDNTHTRVSIHKEYIEITGGPKSRTVERNLWMQVMQFLYMPQAMPCRLYYPCAEGMRQLSKAGLHTNQRQLPLNMEGM